MPVNFRELGLQPYAFTHAAMKRFTEERDDATPDEIWTLEHPSVYTLGLAGRPEYLHEPGSIPIIKTDRGGQVSYHGPGQLIVYTLLDLRRLGITPRSLVQQLEQSVIDLLGELGLEGDRRAGAPGVYVDGRKIAALGVRIRRGCSYHGLAVNVDVDLGPFAGIDPCGYPGLQVTRLADLGVTLDSTRVAEALRPYLTSRLGLDGQAAEAPRRAARSFATPSQAPQQDSMHGR
ncbi:MAG: lipoyl(octanoyl) transferase LipB [Gammaproteobacteria bacterium]|nr:lipoyl(octanoyl) transferase LipB [Gammaproteobacteria bacterium]